MKKSALLVAFALVAVASASATASRSTPTRDTARSKPKPARLSSFHSCRGFLSYVKREAAPFAGPWGFGPYANQNPNPGGGHPVARPAKGKVWKAAKTKFSGTNVQEQGVDEPDIVKTDGEHIFSIARGRLQAVRTLDGKPDLVDWLDLEDRWAHDLLLRGDRLLVLSRSYDLQPYPGESLWLEDLDLGQTILSEVDISDPAHLRLVRRLTFEGAYADARLIGGTARVVLVSPEPNNLPFREAGWDADEEAIEKSGRRNRDLLSASRARHWLPAYTVTRGRRGRETKARVQCRQVRKPPTFSGVGLTTVLTIDLDKGLVPTDVDAIFSDASVVYGAEKSLYVTTERWAVPDDGDGEDEVGEIAEAEEVTTEIHKFETEHPTQTRYLASGRVRGYLLNQWALSEHESVLRVASTTGPYRWAQRHSRSRISTFRQEGGKLARVGWLGHLGHGERIYAVRYLDDLAFLVTFQDVDPLYVLDLSRPTSPQVLGKLKIPGYSSYLHPVAEDLLLGIGQDVREGQTVGTQLSLFDVSDRRQPVRKDKLTIDLSRSQAEDDHHAFLFWPPEQLAVIPIETWTEERMQSGALAFRVGPDGIAPAGKITHAASRQSSSQEDDTTAISRSLVIGDVLYTVSAAGIRATRIDSLERAGWARFK